MCTESNFKHDYASKVGYYFVNLNTLPLNDSFGGTDDCSIHSAIVIAACICKNLLVQVLFTNGTFYDTGKKKGQRCYYQRNARCEQTSSTHTSYDRVTQKMATAKVLHFNRRGSGGGGGVMVRGGRERKIWPVGHTVV